ncbi:MAG: hypothetical protein IKX10_07845 [Lachnospiraceae bacterium]|nr:hypothetical protein [Lachnospiraceae bacterium]
MKRIIRYGLAHICIICAVICITLRILDGINPRMEFNDNLFADVVNYVFGGAALILGILTIVDLTFSAKAKTEKPEKPEKKKVQKIHAKRITDRDTSPKKP